MDFITHQDLVKEAIMHFPIWRLGAVALFPLLAARGRSNGELALELEPIRIAAE
jgi:hypothetical protein